MKGLDEFLAKELGMAVKVLRPFDALGLRLPDAWKISQPAFTVPLGLAFQAGQGLALMPISYRLRALDKTVTRWTKVIAVTTVAGFLVMGGALKLGQMILGRRLAAGEQQCAALVSPTQMCKKIQEMQKTIREREQLIVGPALRQPLWEGIFKDIGNTIPDNVVLTELSLVPQSVPKTLRLVGTIYADNLSADSQLSAFMDKMGVGPYLLSFDLASRKKVPNAGVPSSTFEIRGVLEY